MQVQAQAQGPEEGATGENSVKQQERVGKREGAPGQLLPRVQAATS